jgi:hypothetical protein
MNFLTIRGQNGHHPILSACSNAVIGAIPYDALASFSVLGGII